MFVCSLVADIANFNSELSKCKQSKSILKVMTLMMMMPWLRDIFHLKPKPIAISSYCASFAHLIIRKPSFLIILHVSIGIHVNYVKVRGMRVLSAMH